MKKLPRAKPGEPSIPEGTVWNRTADEVERLGKITVAPPLNVANGHNGVHFWLTPGGDDWVPWKIVGDTKLGGTYDALIGTVIGAGDVELDGGTSNATLTLPVGGVDFSDTNSKAAIINTAENGLAIHVLATNGSVQGWAPIVGSYKGTTSSAVVPLLAAAIPLPPTLSCTNTAAATNAPVYTLFRHGTSTNQALAVSQTPWRQVSLTGISGTSLPTITAATNCNYFLSGTGVAMAGSSETISNYLCP